MDDRVVARKTKKLVKEQYDRIMLLRGKGYSYGRLAEMFEVSRATIFNYVNGHTSPPKENE